jgi:hypothetical protein
MVVSYTSKHRRWRLACSFAPALGGIVLVTTISLGSVALGGVGKLFWSN